MKIKLEKKDKLLIIIVLVIAACAFASHYFLRDTGTGNVIVKVNGEITGTYNLNDDCEVSINDGTNILEIKNGKANMIEADCPDQLCVHHVSITSDKENIICLPNKVFVEIRSKADSKVDAITN